jgi:ribonuclease HI
VRHARSIRLIEPAAQGAAAVSDPATIEIWTDGACRGNPGPGGWGALLRSGSHSRELHGGALQTTNNRMELTAVIEALAALKQPSQVVVHTDSQYVKLGITEWLPQWQERGWKTAARKPVKNVDLWQRLAEQAARHRIEWRWVPAHVGIEGNERADALANLGIDELLGGARG